MAKSFLNMKEALSQSGKTKIVYLSSNLNNSNLGYIAWLAPWRRYCFFPASDTIFDFGCLEEINQKILQLMEERK